jgi:cytochrome c oxidase assembly factor CtaG
VIAVLVLSQPIGGAIALATFAFLLYVPSGYYMDKWLYQRRQRQKQR